MNPITAFVLEHCTELNTWTPTGGKISIRMGGVDQAFVAGLRTLMPGEELVNHPERGAVHWCDIPRLTNPERAFMSPDYRPVHNAAMELCRIVANLKTLSE